MNRNTNVAQDENKFYTTGLDISSINFCGNPDREHVSSTAVNWRTWVENPPHCRASSSDSQRASLEPTEPTFDLVKKGKSAHVPHSWSQ